jgi:GntR family transcriptional regulator, rspAB operon transcriptional repressor
MPTESTKPDVYTELLAQVTTWRLRPGALLSEADLAQQMSVSRTPIREALARLRREGLVVQAAGQTAVVAPVSAETAVELYQAREALEPYALLLAAHSIDHSHFADFEKRFAALAAAPTLSFSDVFTLSQEFDKAVQDACGNAYLARLLQELSAHTGRLRHLTRNDHDRLRRSVRQRADIAAALTAGDGHRAAVLDHSRLRDSLEVVLRELTGHLYNPSHPDPIITAPAP